MKEMKIHPLLEVLSEGQRADVIIVGLVMKVQTNITYFQFQEIR